ncbi:MAG: DUF4878 domain-containing protein [Acidobacteriota bacterium]
MALTLAMMSLGLVACGGGGPEGTVKGFYKDLEAGKIESAAERLSPKTTQSFGVEKTTELLRQGTRDIADKGGIEKIEIVESQVLGEIATVKVAVTFGNGTTDNNELDLTQRDGRWVIEPSMDK